MQRFGFFAGLRYPWRGARFVYVQHPELKRYWLPPVLITLVLLVALGWLAIDLHTAATEWLWAEPTGDDWLGSALRFVHGVFEWLVALALIGFAAVAVALASSVIAAPFNDALSEAVESMVLARSAPPFSLAKALRDLFRTVGLELLKLLAYAAIMLPLLGLGLLVPALAPVLQGIGFAFTALYFAIDYVDSAAARRELSARQRFGWALAHLPAMLGLGAGIWLLLFLPLVNLLFMPAAVAGGTLMFLDLAAPGAPLAGERRQGA